MPNSKQISDESDKITVEYGDDGNWNVVQDDGTIQTISFIPFKGSVFNFNHGQNYIDELEKTNPEEYQRQKEALIKSSRLYEEPKKW